MYAAHVEQYPRKCTTFSFSVSVADAATGWPKRIWDMQYPPRDDLAHSPAAFNASLRRFVRRLGDALGSRAAPSRILWLTVTAVATPSLPSWKRARMSAARSRAFNDLAAPVLRAHGIEVVDTFASGLRHPELSPDGVHFPGTLSQYHAHLLLEQLCSG